jgi:hypothetical protein
MEYFDPRLPDPGAFLERILSPTKMAPALFSLRLEIGFARKYSGTHEAAESRKGYEKNLGNTLSVHDIIIIIIVIIRYHLYAVYLLLYA